MRFNKNNITAYLLMTVLAFIFAACLMESGGFDPGEKEDENKPDESIKSGIFTTAPVFAFAEEIPGSTGLADYIQYRFTAAAPVDGVVYALFIAEGQFNKRDDIITRGDLVTGKQPDTTYTYGPVKAGVLYSSVVVAKSGTDEAISAVQQSLGFSPLGFEEGTGTLKSAGRATQPGQRTFYIDYENGNDSNTGQSPAAAWKTFAKANNTVFRPGDRILLEADSVWNGTPTVGASAGSKPAPYPQSSNFAQFRDQRGNGGMLAPRGNGTADNPIIIDLYDYDKAAGKVYFSANHRPIINGNGTPMLFREDNSISYYDITGAIHLQDVDFWQVRNIETTNSFDFPYIADDPWLRETHIFKRTVFKDLGGIVILGKLPWQQTRAKGMLVEYCYIHDVQQLNRNNNNVYGRYTSKEYIGESWQGKTGALYVVFTESTAQHNIIKNVGLEGMCAQGATGSNVVIRGNYIENVGGDGIVMCQVYDSIVESNICKNVNSAPNLGSANYAGNWCYESRRLLYQYNETYGLLYGNLDGEAWDVDDSSTNVIYQYNYSHHNSGGVCLFMGSQQNSIFRYNISVNDGGGPKYLNSVSDYPMTKYQAFFDGA
ncbi:MAG: right-handed parallel beta-helix repeat-containing protein, partial [Treponema sp.]|nr:right-handed parallel beta-helix repeat-containing protein [Treponema sp.]